MNQERSARTGRVVNALWARLLCRLKGHDWVVAYFVFGPAGGWCKRCHADYYPADRS